MKSYSDYYRDDVARNYRSSHERQPWWHREQRSMAMLFSQLPGVGSVLDVPFGTGRFLDLYASLGAKVTGFDISEDMFLQAQNQWGGSLDAVTLITGDARQLPFADQEFDVVVSARFLQSVLNFGDSKMAIAEFTRVARRNVILGLDFRADKHFRLRKPKNSEKMSGRLRLSEIEELLLQQGFELRDSVGPFKANGQQFHLLFDRKVDSGP